MTDSSAHLADPELEEWLRAQPPFATPDDVEALRAAGLERARRRGPGPEMARMADLDADGVPVRLYVPAGEPAPLLVHLHGGGWTIGSIETHDRLCRQLAAGAGTQVLSVGYRLAPEHRWPASVDDAVTVLRWAANGAAGLRGGAAGAAGSPPAPVAAAGSRPAPVAVSGDSAGGTLATLACRRLRDEEPAALPSAQILLSANTDLAAETESIRTKGRGFAPDARLVRWFNSQWVSDPDRWADPDVSPLRAADLTGLPPALVVTAEHDPLRDEAEQYAARLAAAGVTTTLRRELGVVHNPVMLADVSPACAAALERVIADVRAMLTRG
jgi:acetyl esterase